VRAIRAKTKLSQDAFASVFGFTVHQTRQGEQGRNRPLGAMRGRRLAYVSLFSMLIGFVFWYRGLAQGGIAGVGQLQLLQPFLGLILAAAFLHEPVGWPIIAIAAGVVLCVGGAKRFAA